MASNLGYLENLSTYSSYARNSKAIGILWAFFTVCYGLIGITAFLTPEWLGQEEDASSGRIGLWSVCAVVDHDREVCIGKLENFMSFPGKAFQAATVFIGLAVFSAVLTFCAMLFFLCCHSSTVFFTCGWMQLFSAISMMTGCLTYPLGWSGVNVQRICADSGIFNLGKCELRWGYLLAVIACLDAFILCILAFTLATRHLLLSSDSGSLYEGGVNTAYMGDTISMTGSRKSLNLFPLFSINPEGQEDFYAQMRPRSIHTNNSTQGHLPYSAHNFEI
ncbi:LHFPL tetraspan subfamily member 3 protein isoform X3 [Harmonia axyridis]|uniref:LHFPL tetraspan subfamily member 3 protein isoform X3 n=1 Tax=Harmonia axyridis TaxID=115357 RepID=UPI001E278A46|nr:LHFPL tetraspan subfamily member 3 protein isoform X3 [Harmonia axyridis]